MSINEEWGVELFDDTNTGKAEKTLKDTGEKVLVSMQFYDFVIKTNKNSTDFVLEKKGDGFKDIKWFTFEEIKSIELTPATISLFKKMGLL